MRHVLRNDRAVDVLGDEAGNLGRRISDDVQQCNNIRSSSEVLENLYFSFDLLLLDRLQNFDYTLLVIDDVDTFEDLPNVASFRLNTSDDRLPRTSEYFPLPTFLTIS